MLVQAFRPASRQRKEAILVRLADLGIKGHATQNAEDRS